MGGWKKGVVAADGEADRLDRQKAAFGADTLSNLKDLNVLIVGLRGVGVEAAKALAFTLADRWKPAAVSSCIPPIICRTRRLSSKTMSR